MQKWKKGSGVLLYGTFVMFLAMTMCLFFIQTFYLQQKHQDAQTAADSIADATAVYAATQSSDYDDVTAHAGEVQQKVAEQTGVTTTDLQIDRDKLENDSQVAVSLGLPGTYQSGIAMGRNFGQTSSFMARAGAVTEFTGFGTDYVQWMINIANDPSVGYSQFHRDMNPDVDCSSFVYYALTYAGYDVGSIAFSTSTMDLYLTRAGFQRLPYNSSNLREGDILWRAGHTEVYIGNGQTVGAHSDENGGTAGTQPGDQTGREVSVGNNWGSWTYIYRK